MRLSNIVSTTWAVLHLLGKAQAKAVFAHYMVFSTKSLLYTAMLTSNAKIGTVSEAHVQQDIDDAIAIG